MNINIKRLKNNSILPKRGSNEAAGYDLYACLDSNECTIMPHTTQKVNTGIAVEIPRGFFGAIFARSGIATKRGLRPSNCVGVIDSDYRGEIIVALHNDTDEAKTIKNSERIAQLIVMPFMIVEFTEVENLNDTERGKGGFGSTDTTSYSVVKPDYTQMSWGDLPYLTPDI